VCVCVFVAALSGSTLHGALQRLQLSLWRLSAAQTIVVSCTGPSPHTAVCPSWVKMRRTLCGLRRQHPFADPAAPQSTSGPQRRAHTRSGDGGPVSGAPAPRAVLPLAWHAVVRMLARRRREKGTSTQVGTWPTKSTRGAPGRPSQTHSHTGTKSTRGARQLGGRGCGSFLHECGLLPQLREKQPAQVLGKSSNVAAARTNTRASSTRPT
jgi:hypothetical protein